MTKLLDSCALPPLLQTLQLVADPITFLDRCARRFGDTFTTRVLGWNSPPVVFFSAPEAISEIFTTQADCLALGQVTHPFRPLVGDLSLIMQEGKPHQRQRQLLMPPLHGDRMKFYGSTICAITRTEIANWRPGMTLSIRPIVSAISLQVILRMVFGLAPGQRYEHLKQHLDELLEAITSPLYSSQFFFPQLQRNLGPWSPWGRFLYKREQIDRLIAAEIGDRRQHSEMPRGDVLELLLTAQDESGEVMTDIELRDQLMTLLLLGHETTASALTWAFYWIHQQPQVEARLRQELAQADTPEAIAQLPWLNAICKETLRIYPIALIAQPRVVRKPVQIEGRPYKPGEVLVPCIYTAHRRAATYPNPEQFRPERFLQKKMSPYEFFPFGGGARSCIGAAFSLYEMKLVLATILQTYRLAPAHTTLVRPMRRGITFVPSDNFRLRVVG